MVARRRARPAAHPVGSLDSRPMGTPKNPDGFRSWTADRGERAERGLEGGAPRRRGCLGLALLALLALLVAGGSQLG